MIGKLIFAKDQLIPCFFKTYFLVPATANCRISLIICAGIQAALVSMALAKKRHGAPCSQHHLIFKSTFMKSINLTRTNT